MKNVMLAIELFSIYICAASCLIHKPNNKKGPESSINKDRSSETALPRPEEAYECQRTQDTVTALATNTKEETGLLDSVVSDKIEPTPPDSLLEWEVNFKALSLAACRKIAGNLSQLDKDRLGVSQKVNGKDKPLGQLQQEIKSRCKHYPDEVNPVVRSHCNPKAKVTVSKAIPLLKVPQHQGNSRSA